MNDKFLDGRVFAFDVGTGSVGYAVREGGKFLDVGVLICDSEGSDLAKRRELRRQRRTLRSKKYRRKWLSQEMEKLGLPKPKQIQDDPIALRLRALNGEKISPEELHAALFHLARRRGYVPVPWANRGASDKNSENAKEEGEIKQAVSELREKLAERHPCQYLADERVQAGKSPTNKWARRIYWPRESLEKEFRTIVTAQKSNYPSLSEKVDWLLYGDTAKVKGYHVYFKNTDGKNPGLLGMKWPRFDNRGPALDSLQPMDEQGRPLHVVRKKKEVFQKAQWELAVINFRVIEISTGKLVIPSARSMARLHEIWENSKRKSKLKRATAPEVKHTKDLEVSKSILEKWSVEFSEQYKMVDGQQALTPQTGAGRARYASPTLVRIAAGEHFDPPQPILQRNGESPDDALNRYIAEIKHPLVRHRIALFRRLLADLMKQHGPPDIIVLEAARSLALGKNAKNELNKRNEQHRKERELARGFLTGEQKSTSRKAITRYRLWKEVKSICPFCYKEITQAQLLNGEADIEHLVPRSLVDCNELYNLTVGHIRCNREIKGDKTPFAAFSNNRAKWEELTKHAKECFKGRKLAIFLSPDAEELIERTTDLQHTAYIARLIRGAALLQLGWVGKDGRDPTIEKGNTASSSFQVTNGQLTGRLRGAWGLNQILHPLPSGRRWDDLNDEEKKQFTEKNRGDLRHHALDAMVIACTLPWLAHRTHGAKDENGDHGWWTQDKKQRSKAANPVFPREGQMLQVCKAEIERVVVRQHVSRSNHQRAYATTLYAKKAPGTYVAREVFTTLTPKNLGSIWPKEFAYYCEAAWQRYCEESPDIDAELKKTKGYVPESFANRLCFSHFQKWREGGAPEFTWPKSTKIPIRSVRLISVKDDTAVAPSSPGSHAYVKRTGFKEVRIHLAEDGKSFVPVFIPYWKGDKPIHDRPIKPGQKAVAVIRRGMVLETKKAFSTGHLPGRYRVLATSQNQLKLLPHHVANKEEAILSFGLGKKGLQPYWPDFIRVLGYEPPHPPSPEPQPAGTGKA